MTGELYYQDVYLREFEGVVTQVKEQGGKFHIALDQTAFYPEGGGQPSDLGELGGAPVEHVYKENGRVYHVVSEKPEEGGSLHGKVDWDRRFHFMQQHSGQHILSAVLYRDLGLETLSVHFSMGISTLDVAQPLGEEALHRLEQEVNAAVYANLPIETLYPTPEEIEKMSRKHAPQTDEEVRIVRMGDLDYTPCCGTHCTHTGEVGIIKVLKGESYKGGTRILFACGGAAVERFSHMVKEVGKLQALLSVGEDALADRVEKLVEELREANKRGKALSGQLAEYRARQMWDGAQAAGKCRVVAEILETGDMDTLKEVYKQLSGFGDVVALLGAKGAGNACLFFAGNVAEYDVHVREAFQAAIKAIDGKGGGRQQYQGTGASSDALEAAVQNAREMVLEEL